eukprot:7142196-Pyramimonas_sp.AAC.1
MVHAELRKSRPPPVANLKSIFVVLPCGPRSQTDGVARPRPQTNTEAEDQLASQETAAKPRPNTDALGH